MNIQNGLGIVFLLILIGATVTAQPTEPTTSRIACIDNQTLLTNVSEFRCIVGVCETLSNTKIEYCDYGCDNMTISCSPNPFDVIIWYAIPLIVLFIIAVVVVVKKA